MNAAAIRQITDAQDKQTATPPPKSKRKAKKKTAAKSTPRDKPPAKRKAKAKPKTKAKMGRPRIQFDLAVVEGYGSINCTYEEMAALFGTNDKTIADRMQNDPDFSGAYKTGLGKRRAGLRRRQTVVAMGDPARNIAPNPAMLIWLGKQELGQTEKVESVGADAGEDLAAVWAVIKGWKTKFHNGSSKRQTSRSTAG